ncbi:MAG: HupE/UreJ family protein [Plesiomonas shigelloides]
MLFQNIYCNHGIGSGFLQPFSGMTLLLVLFAAGLLSVHLQEHKRLRLPLFFLCYLFLGLVVGMLEVPMPWMVSLPVLSVIFLGLTLSRLGRMTFASAQAVLGVCALIQGYVHGSSVAILINPIWFSFGFLLSSALVLCGFVLLGLLLKRIEYRWLATRIWGHLIVSAGVLMWVF